MSDVTTCLQCGANLIGEPIPQDAIDQGFYGRGKTHFMRTIGIYDRDRDRTVAWRCPDCGYEWDRDEPITGGFRTTS